MTKVKNERRRTKHGKEEINSKVEETRKNEEEEEDVIKDSVKTEGKGEINKMRTDETESQNKIRMTKKAMPKIRKSAWTV